MGDNLRTELVLEALDMALCGAPTRCGLVHHSDRGSQYTSFAFGRRCAGIAPSMGSKGDAYDNAVAESFSPHSRSSFCGSTSFGLETRPGWRSLTSSRPYNRERLHSSIGQLSPVEFERRLRKRISLCQQEGVHFGDSRQSII